MLGEHDLIGDIIGDSFADGKPAYLESSKEANVPFYRRFGFEVIEKIVPAKGCPPLWLMWREAK